MNKTIADSFIQKQIDNCKCPSAYFCTVATTGYEPHQRERMCLRCWVQYCKTNGIEIDYEK